MSHGLRSWLLGGYLFLCIVFGGSAQGMWTNLALQIGGIGLMAVAAIARRDKSEHCGRSSLLQLLLLCGLGWVLLQLIPLPASVWTVLPGRESLVAGLSALEYQLPATPISESPYSSVTSLFSFLPAVAAFIGVLVLRPGAPAVVFAVLGGMVLGILVGALQVAGGPHSWAYFYPISSSGAVGFFANRNHMATLLLAGIPATAALIASGKSSRRSRIRSRYAIGAAILVLIIFGVALNGSLAAFGLVVPVVIASAAVLPGAFRWRPFVVPIGAVILIAGIVLVAANPIGSTPLQQETSTSVNSRIEIWAKTVEAIRDSFPSGTGLGTFRQIYHRYEDPANIVPDYVDHAHNDYLELVLELGLPGLLLITLFLAWWSISAVRIWGSHLSSPFVRTATIVTATVLAHSIVEFPLRTAAMSAIFAAFVAMMAQHLAAPASATLAGSRATRHVTLG